MTLDWEDICMEQLEIAWSKVCMDHPSQTLENVLWFRLKEPGKGMNREKQIIEVTKIGRIRNKA